MPLILITGLPATGKTTVGKALAEAGYMVVEADTEFGYYGHLMSETPVTPPDNIRKLNRAWYAENGWLWDSAKLRQFLLTPRTSSVFVVGGARNEKKFYRHFDKIFMLHVPGEVLQQRLRQRQDPRQNNDVYVHRMLVWNRGAVDRAANIGATVVKTDGSISAAVGSIIGDLHDH